MGEPSFSVAEIRLLRAIADGRVGRCGILIYRPFLDGKRLGDSRKRTLERLHSAGLVTYRHGYREGRNWALTDAGRAALTSGD